MPMGYTVTNLGNRHVYRADAAIEGQSAPRWAVLYNPTADRPNSAYVETSNGTCKNGVTIDQGHFVARCFVEWNQPDGVTFAVVEDLHLALPKWDSNQPRPITSRDRPLRHRTEPQPAAYADEAAYLEALTDYRLP